MLGKITCGIQKNKDINNMEKFAIVKCKICDRYKTIELTKDYNITNIIVGYNRIEHIEYVDNKIIITVNDYEFCSHEIGSTLNVYCLKCQDCGKVHLERFTSFEDVVENYDIVDMELHDYDLHFTFTDSHKCCK